MVNHSIHGISGNIVYQAIHGNSGITWYFRQYTVFQIVHM